jgi:hypothetical protein
MAIVSRRGQCQACEIVLFQRLHVEYCIFYVKNKEDPERAHKHTVNEMLD